MHVINHTSLPREHGDGCECQTVAGPQLCDAPFEVRLLRLEAGAATPPCRHETARVVLVLSGSGKERLEGAPQSFHAPCTVHVPAGSELAEASSARRPRRGKRRACPVSVQPIPIHSHRAGPPLPLRRCGAATEHPANHSRCRSGRGPGCCDGVNKKFG